MCISLFERLVMRGEIALHTLNEQRRMHPAVSQLLRGIYPKLRDHESVLQRPTLLGFPQNLVYLSHTQQVCWLFLLNTLCF